MKMASALPLEPLQASLADRVVLVTGATGGLGRAISLACAQAGATVVIHGRVVRKLEALYDEIMAAKLPEPTILPLDFARAEASDFDGLGVEGEGGEEGEGQEAKEELHP